MNCIPDRPIRMHTSGAAVPGRSHWLLILALSWFTACGAPASDAEVDDAGLKYQIEYSARPDPDAGLVEVELRLRQPANLLRELRFRFDPERIFGFEADGDFSADDSLPAGIHPTMAVRYAGMSESHIGAATTDTMPGSMASGVCFEPKILSRARRHVRARARPARLV